jgi:hypothetical protein
LKECGLSIKDLIDANMKNIVETDSSSVPPKVVTAEEFVDKVEKGLRNQCVNTLK